MRTHHNTAANFDKTLETDEEPHPIFLSCPSHGPAFAPLTTLHAADARATKPNIILFLIDDFG